MIKRGAWPPHFEIGNAECGQNIRKRLNKRSTCEVEVLPSHLIDMKIACFFCALVLCFVSVSCVTQELADPGVSSVYAWLDTPPRPHMRDTRPQSTLTEWKTGLPPRREARVAVRNESQVSQASKHRASNKDRGDSDRSRQNIDSYSYSQGYRTSYAGRSRKYRRHDHGSVAPQRQGFVRTVEKVGPSIVPQLSVPLSTRSYSGGPRILPAIGTAIVPIPTPQVRRDVGTRVHYSRDHAVRARR